MCVCVHKAHGSWWNRSAEVRGHFPFFIFCRLALLKLLRLRSEERRDRPSVCILTLTQSCYIITAAIQYASNETFSFYFPPKNVLYVFPWLIFTSPVVPPAASRRHSRLNPVASGGVETMQTLQAANLTETLNCCEEDAMWAKGATMQAMEHMGCVSWTCSRYLWWWWSSCEWTLKSEEHLWRNHVLCVWFPCLVGDMRLNTCQSWTQKSCKVPLRMNEVFMSIYPNAKIVWQINIHVHLSQNECCFKNFCTINEEQCPCRSHGATTWLVAELWLPDGTCSSVGSSYIVVCGVFTSLEWSVVFALLNLGC